ncbi:hypothetical protein PVAP13_3NG041880 [Panicum virgatum]|nr:hypothetical protein PVAP13_3NG041880 [Panicum virgatum]
MLLYSAPILTFKRVIKEASVGEFSCIPYILTLFSCLTYSCIYLWFAPKEKKKLVILIVSLFLAIFAMTILISCFIIHTHHIIGVLSAMLMYGSPLVAVKRVVRTRSVEFMPFYLSLFSFLTSLIWMVYGLLGRDPYITSPSCVGCATGILQLVVYCIYSRSKERPKTQNNMGNDMEVATGCKDTTERKP